jgi:hypothetical protein
MGNMITLAEYQKYGLEKPPDMVMKKPHATSSIIIVTIIPDFAWIEAHLPYKYEPITLAKTIPTAMANLM